MSPPPPYELIPTAEFAAVLDAMEHDQGAQKKLRKVRKTLALLEVIGPAHPGLQSHKYDSISGPNHEEVWASYVENHTPSAWRLFWYNGPSRGQITLLTVGPHP